MSTLKTNTISHLSSGFNNVVTHTDASGTVNAAHCRAWVNFNGTGTVAINAQFNVSSITDNGTGDYTVNFSNAMSDANYVVSGTSSGRNGVDWVHTLGINPTDSSGNPILKSTSQVRIVSFTNYSGSPGGQDVNGISVLIHR
jgi:hypothetical protein